MRRVSPSVVFFLLPFFLMAGVALQSAGLYLCLVLIPLMFGLPAAGPARRVILSTATVLALCYLVPVITQSLLAFFNDPLRSCVVNPPKIPSCEMTPAAWLKSPVSSAFVGLALGWILLASLKPKKAVKASANAAGVPVLNDDAERLNFFSRGLLWATLAFFSYGAVQHLTGFNLLSADRILADEHRMPNGQYRIFGFYGHPLSLAGASLVWFSVAINSLHNSLKASSPTFGLKGRTWLLISILQTGNIYMSGGRTALVVAVLFWGLLCSALIWGWLRRRFLSRWLDNNPVSAPILILLVIGCVGAAGALCAVNFVSEWNPRGMGGGTMGQGPLGDRPLFWQTYVSMWQDSPLLGQGYFAVEHGVRDSYYISGGLANLHDKYNAHNIFLEVIGISGSAGLMAYIGLLVLLFLNLKLLTIGSAERRTVLRAAMTALAANLLHGLTQNTFFDSAVSACYLGIIGLFILPPMAPRFSLTRSQNTL